MKSDPTLAWPVASIATALSYALAAGASLLLTGASGFGSPLYPSAGIALVSVLMFGWRMLPAVWAGSFIAQLLLKDAAPMTGVTVALALVIGFGAALQAGVGAWAVRRFQGLPLTLTEPREVARFFVLGAVLANVVSASVGVAALTWAHHLPAATALRSWLTWWTGDTIGVLIAAPMVLTLIGRPLSLWAPRRRSVALPLAIVTVLAALAIVQARRWDEDRSQALFERDAAGAYSAVTQRLQTPLHALEAMYALFVGSDDVSRDEFRAASSTWTDGDAGPQALGWAERVSADRLAAFEARARADGTSGYAVYDRGAAGERLPPGGGELMPIRYIEPTSRNAMALGVNALSVPQARQAIELARRSQRPAASVGFRLTQERGQQTGVVVYRAVYRAAHGTAAPPAGEPSGVLFVSLRMDEVLQRCSPGCHPISSCASSMPVWRATRRRAGSPVPRAARRRATAAASCSAAIWTSPSVAGSCA